MGAKGRMSLAEAGLRVNWKRLIWLMTLHGYTVGDVSAKSGVSQITIRKMRSPLAHEIDTHLLMKVAQALGEDSAKTLLMKREEKV